jgi:hypothetical protein
VVERRAAVDQGAHHAVMAEMGGGDQSRAVVPAGDQGGVAAGRQRDFDHFGVVGDGGDGDDVVAVEVEAVHVCAGVEKRLRRLAVAEMGRHHHGRPAAAVRRVELGSRFGQPADRRGIAGRRGAVQTFVSGNLDRAWRDLRRERARHEK